MSMPPGRSVGREIAEGATLRHLLRYVVPHRKSAGLTLFFGVLGFVLSFVYPWIIGSVVDLAIASRSATTPART